MTAVKVDDLRMRYGRRDVLHDVAFEADHGEVVAPLGPNGAGKTTAVEILAGFRTRSAGRVEVLGRDPERADERWRARAADPARGWPVAVIMGCAGRSRTPSVGA